MCAGGCREPRCIRSPGRGSQRLHRALSGTRILLAAAPTAPPCFCRWQRSSLLHRGFFPAGLFGGSMLFESTLAVPFSRQIKQKLRYPLDTGVLGGRGWIARAALLKTAHWAVFALSSATAPQLFESALASPFSRQIKQKLRYPLDTGVLGGRGWIRTTEAESSRFTVCPHWPLGNTPIFIFAVMWTACICYH